MVNPAACPETDYSCWANLEICEVEVNGEHCNGTQIKKKRKNLLWFRVIVLSTVHKLTIFFFFFAACAFGTYGPNCEHQCNCKGETCDPETGLCQSGCSEGRMGPKCDQGLNIMHLIPFDFGFIKLQSFLAKYKFHFIYIDLICKQ